MENAVGAAFAGTTYQGRVAAYVCCHMLAESPLGWVGAADIPTSVVSETGGVGDDLLIKCGQSGPHFEVQAKHGALGERIPYTRWQQ